MAGVVFLIVGARGTGKSTEMRKMLEKVHPKARLVYDPSDQFSDLFPYPLIEFKDFTPKMVNVSNALIAIDEATIFLSNRGNDDDVKNVLVKARHKNNIIVFCFHSFRSIPFYIYELSDYVIILKTGDNEDLIQSRFKDERLTQAFIRIKNLPWKEGKTRRYSPSETFDIYG